MENKKLGLCGDCAYFDQDDKGREYCARNPPVINSLDIFVSPRVGRNNNCGEFLYINDVNWVSDK
jgi:hypothetical protein